MLELDVSCVSMLNLDVSCVSMLEFDVSCVSRLESDVSCEYVYCNTIIHVSCLCIYTTIDVFVRRCKTVSCVQV